MVQMSQEVILLAVEINSFQGHGHQLRAGSQQCCFHPLEGTEFAGAGEQAGMEGFAGYN
jgi:hypothetical protein